jgi:hypothetical protein
MGFRDWLRKRIGTFDQQVESHNAPVSDPAFDRPTEVRARGYGKSQAPIGRQSASPRQPRHRLGEPPARQAPTPRTLRRLRDEDDGLGGLDVYASPFGVSPFGEPSAFGVGSWTDPFYSEPEQPAAPVDPAPSSDGQCFADSSGTVDTGPAYDPPSYDPGPSCDPSPSYDSSSDSGSYSGE